MMDNKNRICKEYVIPEEFIKENATYVVYGFGTIGKIFSDELSANPVITFLGAVDKQAEKIIENRHRIFSLKDITNLVFDYIIIAVEDKRTANEIKKFLLEEGIEEEKILWNGEHYLNKNFVRQYYENMHQFIKYNSVTQKCKRKFFLFMLPEHGNIGDYAIGYSEQYFLKEHFSDTQLICVTTNQFLTLKKEICSLVNEDDVIFLNGGGYFGTLWGDNVYYEEIVSCFPHNVKIFFPNNFTYKKEISVDNKELMSGITWMKQQKKLYVFFRTKSSYEFAKKYCDNVFYYPDMVFNLSFPNEINPSSKVLLCFRNDREKLMENSDELKNILEERNIAFEEWDLNLQKHISQSDGMDYVKYAVNKIQQYELVITDRLHGMILGVVSEVPVIAFDSSTHKILDVYQWIESLETVTCLSHKADVGMIPEIIEEVSKKKAVYNKPFKDVFIKMAETIEQIICGEETYK